MAVKIGIINYEMGNIQSIVNALEFLGHTPIVSKDIKILAQADAFILPGVGAFGQAMKNLHRLAMVEFLNEEVLKNKKPILGICLGMQLMCNSSEELGIYKGLEWIDAEVLAIPRQKHIRVPHVGWNTLKITQKEPLFSRLEENTHFYFDHSFYISCNNSKNIMASCQYSTEMCVGFRQENIFATQFHPEKSQTNGLKLLRNFLNYSEAALW